MDNTALQNALSSVIQQAQTLNFAPQDLQRIINSLRKQEAMTNLNLQGAESDINYESRQRQMQVDQLAKELSLKLGKEENAQNKESIDAIIPNYLISGAGQLVGNYMQKNAMNKYMPQSYGNSTPDSQLPVFQPYSSKLDRSI